MHQTPVGVTLDSGQGVGEESLDVGELLVAGGQHAVGDQHVAQVVRRLPVRVRVERLVAAGQLTGGELAQHLRAGTVAEPVQRAAWRAGGGDRGIDRLEGGRDLLAGSAQQLAGASAQRAVVAAAAFVELVLDAAARRRRGRAAPRRSRRRRSRRARVGRSGAGSGRSRCRHRGGAVSRCSRSRRPVLRASAPPGAVRRRSARTPPWTEACRRHRSAPGRTRTNTVGAARSVSRPLRASGSRHRRCRVVRRGRGGRCGGSARTGHKSVGDGRLQRPHSGRCCSSRPRTSFTTRQRAHAVACR